MSCQSQNGGVCMRIELSKEEYFKLFELIYIGEWVLNCRNVGENEDTKEYTEAMGKYLSYAKEFGFEDFVDEYSSGFEPSRKFEDESRAHTFLNQYDNDVFWDELIERLAKRDVVKKHGKQSITRIYKDENLFNELQEVKKEYSKEFSKNGLKELKIK